jgi:hypothetical protein
VSVEAGSRREPSTAAVPARRDYALQRSRLRRHHESCCDLGAAVHAQLIDQELEKRLGPLWISFGRDGFEASAISARSAAVGACAAWTGADSVSSACGGEGYDLGRRSTDTETACGGSDVGVDELIDVNADLAQHLEAESVKYRARVLSGLDDKSV